MILVDLNQLVLATFMVALNSSPKGGPGSIEVDVGTFRHIAVNSIRAVKAKFGREFGEMVLCADSRNTWRKVDFPYYKANRKKARDSSFLDWDAVFAAMDTVKAELRDNFPYRFVQVDGCEADDVIAALVRNRPASEDCLIVSSDEDFVQLQTPPGDIPAVKQWDNVRKKWVQYDSHALKRKIIRGDTGDGVPNFMTDDDTLVTPGKRSTPIMSKKEAEWLDMEPSAVWQQAKDPEAAARNWKRNETLVDLSRTPDFLVRAILDKYSEKPDRNRTHVLSYLNSVGLKKIAESLQDF